MQVVESFAEERSYRTVPRGLGTTSSSEQARAAPLAMHILPDDDNLLAWIAKLRARLDRGDLATLTPGNIGFRTGDPPAELTIRIMLADLDSFADMDPDEAADPVNIARRASLLADFRTLQFFIDS